MTPYHYAIIQCRHAAIRGEWRNVAVLVVSPSTRTARLLRAHLGERAGLHGDDAAFVTALLDVLEQEAAAVAGDGDAAGAHGWLQARANGGENGLSLSSPAVGVADDIGAVVRDLARTYLGEAADVPA